MADTKDLFIVKGLGSVIIFMTHQNSMNLCDLHEGTIGSVF